ncbi:MAG: hypothetical protein J4428_02215 [Candidatus Aenigmarchaeota archaeon]|nr:hypothetical protein [Candidatus Aenigmarchaeota archaeon]
MIGKNIRSKILMPSVHKAYSIAEKEDKRNRHANNNTFDDFLLSFSKNSPIINNKTDINPEIIDIDNITFDIKFSHLVFNFLRVIFFL